MTVDAQFSIEILTRLDAIHQRLERIDQRLANTRAVGQRLENEQAVCELITCIAGQVGEHAFATSDLLDRVPREADKYLRVAMVRAVGAASPRRVGQLLKRREGETVCGYTITRDGHAREGVLWLLVRNGR